MVARARVYDEQRARREQVEDGFDICCCGCDGRRECSRFQVSGGVRFRRGAAVPAPQRLEFAEARPRELDSTAGDKGPVRIAQHRAPNASHDLGVARAADGVARGRLREMFLRRAVIDDGAFLALALVPSAGAGARKPLEDRFALCVRAAPFGALFAFEAHEIEAGAGVFDAVVAGCAVAALDLAGEVSLAEPFEGGFQGWAAWMWVEKGGVDYEGVS